MPSKWEWTRMAYITIVLNIRRFSWERLPPAKLWGTAAMLEILKTELHNILALFHHSPFRFQHALEIGDLRQNVAPSMCPLMATAPSWYVKFWAFTCPLSRLAGFDSHFLCPTRSTMNRTSGSESQVQTFLESSQWEGIKYTKKITRQRRSSSKKKVYKISLNINSIVKMYSKLAIIKCSVLRYIS